MPRPNVDATLMLRCPSLASGPSMIINLARRYRFTNLQSCDSAINNRISLGQSKEVSIKVHHV